MCVCMKGPEKYKQQIIKRHSHNIKNSINSSINKEKKRIEKAKKGRFKRFDSSRGADGCEHRHPSVLQFRLATPAEGLYIAILGQAKRIEVSHRSLAGNLLGRDGPTHLYTFHHISYVIHRRLIQLIQLIY